MFSGLTKEQDPAEGIRKDYLQEDRSVTEKMEPDCYIAMHGRKMRADGCQLEQKKLRLGIKKNFHQEGLLVVEVFAY